MKKGIIFLFFVYVFSVYGFSQAANNEQFVTVEVSNVVINGGNVILVVFANAEEFRREEPGRIFVLQPDRTLVSRGFSLPYGEYVISAFQDENNNNAMDYGLMGIPKERFGITGYNGRGFPTRNFDRQKIRVDNTTERITIGLFKL